jgi:hypothetical protein
MLLGASRRPVEELLQTEDPTLIIFAARAIIRFAIIFPGDASL